MRVITPLVGEERHCAARHHTVGRGRATLCGASSHRWSRNSSTKMRVITPLVEEEQHAGIYRPSIPECRPAVLHSVYSLLLGYTSCTAGPPAHWVRCQHRRACIRHVREAHFSEKWRAGGARAGYSAQSGQEASRGRAESDQH